MTKGRWICLAAAVLFFFTGLFFRKEAMEQRMCVTLLAGQEKFSTEAFLNLQGENPYTFTLWMEQKTAVEAEETQRSVTAEVLQIYGQSRLLLAAGKNLQPADREGCIIGEKLAKELFGSPRAEGQQLVLGQRRLTVRGVISAPGQALICEADITNETFAPDHISVAPREGEDTKTLVNGFVSYYGVNAAVLRYDYYLRPIQLEELLPGKWSDFSGWAVNVKSLKESFQTLDTAPKSCIEEAYMQMVRYSYGCLAVGVALGLCWLKVGKSSRHGR